MTEQPPGSVRVGDVLSLILRHGQNLLVYPAAFDHVFKGRPSSINTPAHLGIPYIAPLLRTPDNIDLSCYLLPQTHETLRPGYRASRRRIKDVRVELTPDAADARATMVVFHGNSAHHWEDIYSAMDLWEMGCNVFLLSYRGYSLSGGSPNEKGLRIDAQTALDYILNQPHLRQAPIVSTPSPLLSHPKPKSSQSQILYGHSLGGGVAIDLASRNPSKISGLIVSNTFTSIPDIVRHWPYIGPLSFLCHQKWKSAHKMRLIPTTTPILMLSGRRDEVIPPELMDRLWEKAQRRGERRRGAGEVFGGWSCVRKRDLEEEEEGKGTPGEDVFVTIGGGTHNDTPNSPEYWAAIRDFIQGMGHRAEERPPPLEVGPAPPPVQKGRGDRRWRYINRELVVVEGDEKDKDKDKGRGGGPSS
ncbi:Alpha/Beta hydrolase protein [Lyophyllum atratum]|nr:Alpha/Beta hydrolase protein [Lyophyllum atratum]